MSWLPAQSPAHAAALATCLLGAAQLWAILKAARAWGASPAASATAGLLYALGPLPLLIFTQAEVFALNGLMAALIVWLCAPEGPAKGAPRAAWLGLLAGLALSNHLSSVWLAPLGLFGAALGLREASTPKARVLGALGALAGLVAGLAVYLTMIPQADGGWTWGHPRALADVWGHMLRKDYGTFTLHGGGQDGLGAANLAALGRSLARAWLWGGPALALLGLWTGLAQPQRRWAWAAFAATFLAAGPGFILMFNIDPRGLGLHIVERFHILPALLLVPWVALGLDRLARALAAAQPSLAELAPTVWLPVWVASVALTAHSLSLQPVREGHSPAVERYLTNTLGMLPPNAALIASGDHRLFGFLYAQSALGLRPDVLYIDYEMLSYPWYRARVEARLGHPLIPDGPQPASVRMARNLMALGRPVFLASLSNANLTNALPSYPLGTCIRLLPEGQLPPDPVTLAQENEALLHRFRLDYPGPLHPDEGWAVEPHNDYARPWLGLASIFDRVGDPRAAQAARRRAAALAPWSLPQAP